MRHPVLLCGGFATPLRWRSGGHNPEATGGRQGKGGIPCHAASRARDPGAKG